MKTSNASLQKTKNYDRFLFNEMNRNINASKVYVLKKKMTECGGFRPSDAIHVKRRGNKFVIQRGHHRYVAAKALNIPFYYIVDDSDFDIVSDAETRSDWNATEISVGLANAGNLHYIYLLEFMKKNELSIKTSAMLLMGKGTETGGSTKVLRSGQFTVTEEGKEHAQKILPIINECASIGVVFAKHRAFIQALSTLCRLKEFDANRFLQRVRVDAARMMPRNSTIEYVEEIEALYNYRHMNKGYVPLKAKVISNGWYKPRSRH